jgi:undecaprenyl diphosphate synthase
MSEHSFQLPQHIAIIMDGNRRWAQKHGLAALKGHSYVSDHVIEPLVDRCIELQIPFLTLWAFSTENWKRDESEVKGLMQIFRQAFDKNGKSLFEKGVRINTIGDLTRFPADIQKGIENWKEKSKDNTKITVTFALNYGGRDEIIRALNKALAEQDTKKNSLTEDELTSHLDTADMPDPDFIIRPGGEQRLSGYLPWQGVYAELYFTDVLMPDFSPAELDKSLQEFAKRKRRFGK